MTPAHFQSFAEAYAPEILVSARILLPDTCGQSLEDYALDASLALLERVQKHGLESIAHYGLHRQAFPAVCRALRIEPTLRAAENYLQ